MDDRDLISPGAHEDELTAGADEAEHEPEAPNENWLVSYADLMTLLFGFFAMLYLTQVIAPPKELPKPQQKQERKAEEQTEPSPAVPIPPPRQMGSAGGNRGFHFLNLVPDALLLQMVSATLLYILLFLLGTRLQRVIVDPTTGSKVLRKVPVLQVAQSARKPLTEEQLALKAREDEILQLDDVLVFDETHTDVAHMVDERWLISYADLMTLLFGFFAMLYLMGQNFDAVKASMDETFTKAQKARISRMKPIEVPRLDAPINVVTAPETRTSAITEAATVTEVPTATAISTLTSGMASTAATTAVSSAAETVGTLKPRPTPSLEELQRAEAERIAALKERVKERMQEAAEAKANQERIQELREQRKAEAEGDRKMAIQKYLGKPAERGRGGTGVGGGQGNKAGAGTTNYVGSAICSEGAVTPYSDTCWGHGFFGCLNAELLTMTGGQNGVGGAMEFYCISGRTRVCLTYEYCPWRTGGASADTYLNGYQRPVSESASMNCSPNGLPITHEDEQAVMAVCRGHVDCGFTSMECSGKGRLFFR